MNNEYVCLKEAIDSLGIEKSQLAHYVANSDLHPCFLCDVILIDYRKVDDHMGAFHNVEGLLFISGYIKLDEEGNRSLAAKFNSQNDAIFYISKTKPLELTSSQRNFRDEENEHFWQIDMQRMYQISQASPNFIQGKGLELHTSQCMFLTPEVDKLKNSLSKATTLREQRALKSINDDSSEDVNQTLGIEEQFKLAIPIALQLLDVPSLEMPKQTNGTRGAIRGRVFKEISNDPKTMHLAKSFSSFSHAWTNLLEEGKISYKIKKCD